LELTTALPDQEEAMIDVEGTRNVSIGGNVYLVKVRRKSDSAWIAMREYEGEVLTAEASSREAAVKRWREMAEPKGKKAKR
jgi:hypothetical protein